MKNPELFRYFGNKIIADSEISQQFNPTDISKTLYAFARLQVEDDRIFSYFGNMITADVNLAESFYSIAVVKNYMCLCQNECKD